jgi:hypothetical protein
MKNSLWWLCLFVCISGCSRNHYNVPTENFADRVKVIGIAPIFIDADSDIKHPQKDLIVQLVADLNRKYESQLVRKLKSTGNFYTVALLDGDPQKLFATLLFRRERRDDATIQYNKYFWKADELRSFIQKNNLDAVLIVTVSGLTKTDKVFSGSMLASQEFDYNFLTITSQILDANGTVLWEYPNFRSRLLTYFPLVNLQYPDFSESEANLSHKAEIKFKSLDGIRRILEKKKKDWLHRETQEPEIYGKQFEEIISLIKFDAGSETKPASPPVVKPQAQTPSVRLPQSMPSQSADSKPVQEAIVPATPSTPNKATETTSLTADEIAPATGGVR